MMARVRRVEGAIFDTFAVDKADYKYDLVAMATRTHLPVTDEKRLAHRVPS